MKAIPTSILFLVLTLTAAAQTEKTMNLPEYNSQWIHFGFSLMPTRNNLIVDQGSGSNYSFSSAPGNGFSIGVTSEWNLHKNFALRFIPDLAFTERKFIYQLLTSGNSPVVTQKYETTVMDLPLNVKVRTNRFHNMDLYLLAGGRYSFDLASQKTSANTAPSNSYVQLKKNDYGVEAALGTDIFLPYFKFSIDLKFVQGLRDINVQNGGPSNSVNSIRSQGLVLSLSFEG